MRVSQSLLAMPPSSVHGCIIFTWKMMWHTAWIFQRILSKWPHYRGHAKCSHIQIWSRDLCLSHHILRVASSPDYYGCVVIPYEVNLQAVHTPPGPSLVKLAVSSDTRRSAEPLVSFSPSTSYCVHLRSSSQGEVSLCLHNMHEVSLVLILTSLLTQL